VGQAASHGCVRLYDENVQELYDLVKVGTPVTVLP
jgi:lipoprotein-anchoring transpeptidase ErfK/SrfK